MYQRLWLHLVIEVVHHNNLFSDSYHNLLVVLYVPGVTIGFGCMSCELDIMQVEFLSLILDTFANHHWIWDFLASEHCFL